MSPSDSRHPFASDSITARAGALNLRVSGRSEANVELTKSLRPVSKRRAFALSVANEFLLYSWWGLSRTRACV